jgi:hypothetical protein
MTFTEYTNAVLSALKFNPKLDDVVARKQEILDGVYQTENLEPTSVLFVGFTPSILSCQAPNITVTEISDDAMLFLTERKIKFTYIDAKELVKYRKQFQCVVAMDEYFTYAESDLDQQNKIQLICSLATNFVISTIRDYKNQDFKEREFSQPALIRNSAESIVYLESHDWDQRDRSKWNTMVYEINRSTGATKTYGAFERRTMYFKQLAKFSMDAGAMNFQVHKNLMYKSLIKKNYEHVVSIQFE